MRHKISVLYHNIRGISKDTATLMIGTLIANLIPLGLQPFLKRVYTPEEFGNLEVYLKVFSILVAISSLKYENAILLGKKDNDSKHALVLSIIISVLVFITITLVLTFFSSKILLGIPGLSKISLWILPFSVFSYSIFNSCNLYLIKKKQFFLSATNKIVRRVFEGTTQASLGILNVGSGLFLGDLIGNIIQGTFAISKVKKLVKTKITVNTEKLKQLAREYQDLPKYTLIPNLLNTFVLGSLTFLVLDKYSITEVGYLEFTQKILAVPSVFLSVAISQVVFQRVSELINKKQKIIPFIISITLFLALVSLVFFIAIQLYSTELYSIIGGQEWEVSGDYAKILVYSSCITLIFSPLGKVLIALKAFRVNSAWEIGKFIVILSFFFIEDIPVRSYLATYTIVIICFYLVYGLLIFKYALNYQANISKI